MLTGLQQISLELTSRCSKKTTCFMCGHQSPKVNPNIQFGDMAFSLIESIANQISPPIIVSMHRDGDSVDFHRLGDALREFEGFPVSLVTHGERLAEKADEIIGLCTAVTVSVIPNDPDRDLQIEAVAEFLRKKGDRRPRVQLKCVGAISDIHKYQKLGLPITNRALHSAKGNWNYHRIEPLVPEVQVCLDALSRPAVDWRGRMFLCQRLDTRDEGLIGDLNTQTLDQVWNGPERQRMLRAHLDGKRGEANNLCAHCDFYGVPTPAG
jgi:hypothetical protein